MCIFQIHLISTNSNPTGEGTTRWAFWGLAASPCGKLSSLHGGGGPQQSVEGQDSSWKASKKVVVEVHLRCYIKLCITNAFIVYKESSVWPRNTLLDSRVDVSKELIGQFSRRKRHSCVPQPDQNHRLVRIVGAKRKCRWCSKQRQIRRETVYGCNSCTIHLCKNDCFVNYHSYH